MADSLGGCCSSGVGHSAFREATSAGFTSFRHGCTLPQSLPAVAETGGATLWDLCRGHLGLRKQISNDFLFQRPGAASMWIHTGSGGPTSHRRARVVFKSGGRNRLCSGVLPAAEETGGRRRWAVVTFALSTEFFAVDMALIQRRYLGILPRCSPHLAYMRVFPQPSAAQRRPFTLRRQQLPVVRMVTAVFPFSCPGGVD